MSDVMEERSEAVSAEPPATAAPATSDEIDELLAEYTAATAKPEPEPEPATDNMQPETSDEIDKFLVDLETSARDHERIAGLESELNSLRTAEFQRAEREAFDKWTSELQGHLGPNVDDGFARRELLAMSVERPEIEAAWRHRGLTNEQLAAADLEFRRLESLYAQVQRAPADERKAGTLAALEQRGQELGLMMNARTILSNARRDVIKRAEKALPPIDTDQTELRMEIAAIMRGASAKVAPEPPPNFGAMSDQDLRNYTKQFGF